LAVFFTFNNTDIRYYPVRIFNILKKILHANSFVDAFYFFIVKDNITLDNLLINHVYKYNSNMLFKFLNLYYNKIEEWVKKGQAVCV